MNSRFNFLPNSSVPSRKSSDFVAFDNEDDDNLSPAIYSFTPQSPNAVANLNNFKHSGLNHTNYALLHSSEIHSTKDPSSMNGSICASSPNDKTPLNKIPLQNKQNLSRFHKKPINPEEDNRNKNYVNHLNPVIEVCVNTESVRGRIDQKIETEVGCQKPSSYQEIGFPTPKDAKSSSIASFVDPINADKTAESDTKRHYDQSCSPNHAHIAINTPTNSQTISKESESILQLKPKVSTAKGRTRVTAQKFKKRLHDSLKFVLQYLCSIQDVEPKLAMFRALVQSIAIFTASVILLSRSSNDQLPLHSIIAVVYCYMLYQTAENIVRIFISQRPSWRRWDDGFDAFEMVSAMIFLFSLEHSLPYSYLYVPLIFTLEVVLYLIFVDIPKLNKVLLAMTKSLYVVQTLLILTRTGHEDCTVLLIPSWGYFGLNMGKTLIFSWILIGIRVYEIVRSYLSSRYVDTFSIAECAAIFWHIIYESFGVLVYIFIFSFTFNTFHDMKFKFDRFCGWFGIIISLLLVVWTKLGYEQIVRFFNDFDMNLLAAIQEADHEEPEEPELSVMIDLEPLKITRFYLKTSATYYTRINADALLKTSSNKPNNFKNNKLEGTKEIHFPQEEPSPLMQPLEEDVCPKKVKRSQSFCVTDTTIDIHTPPVLQLDSDGKRRLFSFGFESEVIIRDDQEKVQKTEGTKENENLCYICYCEKPNAILLTCGHSGVCYECAATQVKKRGECMECRATVLGIAQIGEKPILKDIYKTVKVEAVRRTVRK